jgi:small subunit ribosomal protein S6
MKKYECMFITDVQLPAEQLKDLVELIKKLISENSGEVIDYQNLGERRLAYPIQNKFHGVYGLVSFNAENNTLKALNERLGYEDRLVRYMITKVEY